MARRLRDRSRFHALFLLLVTLVSSRLEARPLPPAVEKADSLEDASIVGPLGAVRSDGFGAFQKLQSTWSDDDLLHLLRHRNPVVVAYAALYFSEKLPSHWQQLKPLLTFHTKVPRRVSMCESSTPLELDVFIAESLCPHALTNPDIKQLLVRTTRNHRARPVVRSIARTCAIDIDIPQLELL